MDSEGAFEKEAREQEVRRQSLAMKCLDALSKEHTGCDCDDYSELEIALALTIIDSVEKFKEIADLLPEAPNTKEGK